MTTDAEVELDSAAEPRVAEREVARTEHRILVEQLASLVLVIERAESAAQSRYEFSADMVVFDDRGAIYRRVLGAVVAVLHEIGQHGRHIAVVIGDRLRAVLGVKQIGERIQLAEMRGGNCDFFDFTILLLPLNIFLLIFQIT